MTSILEGHPQARDQATSPPCRSFELPPLSPERRQEAEQMDVFHEMRNFNVDKTQSLIRYN